MKKVLYFILIFIALVILGTMLAFLRPNISRRCKIDGYNISLKVPYAYEEEDVEAENSILNLCNENGIIISATKLPETFWPSGDTESRLHEYLKVISSVNYDAEIKNVTINLIENKDNKLGKVGFELRNIEGSIKTIAVIFSEEVGNIVIEFSGPQDVMMENIEKIEKIVNSIKI